MRTDDSRYSWRFFAALIYDKWMIQLLEFFLLYGSTPQTLDLTESKSPSFAERLSLPRANIRPLYIIIQKREVFITNV
jgi:hypothetical protein